MKNSDLTNTQGSALSEAPNDTGFSPWQRLKSKRISYLTVPLLVMATITEFVILATGWKYQQVVCLPKGMGVTFFGIGPIGATILAVELLKLPLAIWTASRKGFQKGFMLMFGLPLICVLTFQLVKDMAVYEMGVALSPASQMLTQATDEEVKITQLTADLANIDVKKADRDRKLAELAAKKIKGKADLEESLKRNEDSRQDAISMTDYQKKELSEVEARQANIIKQVDADTEQLTKTLADLRARREVELGRASKWNAEEARIDNEYKAKMVEYANTKAAYQKAKAEYDHASYLHRKFMSEPIDPGVPPVREVDTILKPAELAEIDNQIAAKEAELAGVNNKRRDRVAQVEADAHHLREEFDQRSTTKREETDHKRDELLAAQATMAAQWAAEEKEIDNEFDTAANKADSIRAQLDDSRKKAEAYYEGREAAIKNTQVYRIATTVEIIRGLVMHQKPVSIKATARERGDLYTDQISMVRIWVYPVLAFIVAFLPTLMVEIGFSTVFEPDQQRPGHRLGFFGRHLHALYIRAGRQKIYRAERIANEASGQIAVREKSIAEKETELQTAREAAAAAAIAHEEQLKKLEEEHTVQAKVQSDEWVAKLGGMADSLNRTVLEKDALRDLQKSEVERQVQMRQNAWSDRIGQMRQELDDQRAAFETERTAMMQAHHKKLMEVSEESKSQVIAARRQAADADLGAVEATARLTHDLKEAILARDTAEAQLKQQNDAFSLQLSQAKEDTAREAEKSLRQEKHRFDRQQLEFGKTLRQREEDFEHQLKQREQELSMAFNARLAEEQSKIEQDSRRRETDLTRQLESRALEVDARWKQDVLQREEASQTRLKHREQQLFAQAEVRQGEIQTQADQELRRRESEFERQFEAQSREAEARLKQELQQKELAHQAKLKQREQELALRADSHETELRNQWASDLRVREEEWERQTQSRIRATETRLDLESKEKDEVFMAKSRQRDQQWQVKLDDLRNELQAQNEEFLRRHDAEADAKRRELDSQLRKEMHQQEEAAQTRASQREQDIVAQLTAQSEARFNAAQSQWEAESEKKVRTAAEPYKSLLTRAEKERDEARQVAAEGARHVQQLEKKLTEASTFLNGWRNGKSLVNS
ncbi:MAG TPA: hypothetical protein VGO67_07180 [Verrucomicrobiae bacterium]|jgi:hypothetical protein